MIITRSPLRISLGTSGTDLLSYHREHEGFVIGAAIDDWYPPALGDKLIGTGGGGFLMFYAVAVIRLRRAMWQAGLPEIRFRFDVEGTKIIAQV